MTVAITGVGAVTALGTGAQDTFDRILAGERAFRELSLFDPGEVRTRLVAEVSALRASSDPAASRTSELAVRAAREALAQSGVDVAAQRVGLVLGGTTAGLLETESLLAGLSSAPGEEVDGARRHALSRVLRHPLSAPTDRVARELGPFCRTRSLSSACSSGASALIVGALWLELGLVDAVLCGGADALCRVTVTGFNALGALDPGGARPFDVGRRGLTLGEGAGMLVLERADAARGRAIATLLGWAARAEAHHITNPDPAGTAPLEAMEAALRRAGLTPADVDYVNAHGTGTPLNDPMEARALARLFGAALERVPVSSQKGMIGHTLGAAGAIEAVITALAIARGVIPPTGGLEEPDPACALRHVTAAEARPVRAALSSSFGFGGMDAALVLGGPDGASPARRAARSVLVTGIGAVTSAGTFAGEDVADLPERALTGERAELPPLDAARARRLDRASRIAAVACERALGAPADPAAVASTGVVLGMAFGAIDATAEFMRRARDKGPRMVRPAEFPSLVPSSPAGHVSIYLGLGGPAMVVADWAASGEGALAQAFELIRSGEAERLLAGGVEERSAIIEEASTVGGGERGARGEGGAFLALASEETEAPALAWLRDVVVWSPDHGDGVGAAHPLAELPPPPAGAIVVVGAATAETEAIVRGSSWAAARRIVCAGASGAHEAAGAVAAAVAAAKVARGAAPAALFVGTARGAGYAGTLWPPVGRG